MDGPVRFYFLGVAYVKFSKMSEAACAMENLNNTVIKNHTGTYKVYIAKRLVTVQEVYKLTLYDTVYRFSLEISVVMNRKGQTMMILIDIYDYSSRCPNRLQRPMSNFIIVSLAMCNRWNCFEIKKLTKVEESVTCCSASKLINEMFIIHRA